MKHRHTNPSEPSEFIDIISLGIYLLLPVYKAALQVLVVDNALHIDNFTQYPCVVHLTQS